MYGIVPNATKYMENSKTRTEITFRILNDLTKI